MKRIVYTLIAISFALTSISAIAQIRTFNARSRIASTFQQVQGSILFANNNVVQTLQQGWSCDISQAAGTKLKVELWQVNYVPSKKDNVFTNILLLQKLDANISYQQVQNGLQYNATYRPISGNVVAIAYTTIPTNAQIKISGKPNDGTPANITHQFKSDAKKHLGADIIYGIYSLPAQQSNLTDISFKVAPSVKGDCKNCFGFDDVWNAVSDAADDVAGFAKAALDGAGEVVKDLGETIVVNNGIFFVQCFGTITTFLQTGNLPKVRFLSDYGNAYNIANSTIFMNSLPPVNKIIVTNLMSVDKRPFTVPIKNGNDVYILMNLGNAFDDPVNYNMNGFPGDVFIHELTHAWQIWHVDALRLFTDGAVNQFKNTVISNQYTYNCDGHNLYESYNEEQQAMIVQYFYVTLFLRPKGITKNGNKITCDFEQQWVVQNILRNQPANIDEQFTATKQIMLTSFDKNIAGNTGGTIDHTLAIPSGGNRADGNGYFLPGKNNNGFFYYSNKNKAVSANWGPIRDKYTKVGYESGELGWPEQNEALLPDGAGLFQKFNHGFIYWSPRHGAYVVLNKIFNAWAPTGWEKGQLGYPVGDYVVQQLNRTKEYSPYRENGYQKFEGGVIFYKLPEAAVVSEASGNNNFTSIVYGDPDKIVNTDRNAFNSVQPVREQVGQQAGQKRYGRPYNNSGAEKVEINPQPLPPGGTVRSGAGSLQPGNAQINPQPLPPKTGKATTGTVLPARVQTSPQPPPPKATRE